MFTGLIETLGTIRVVESTGGVRRLRIASAIPTEEIDLGESIAVHGVCLTVTERAAGEFSVDVIPESLSKTNLGELEVGSRVHLERSLRLSDRLGGHLVQGHVDAAVEVARVRRGDDYRLEVSVPPGLRRFVAFKGSVALDGVSLTVAALTPSGFEVALIPETLERTTLGEREAGDRLNLEVDVVARYLERIASDPYARGGSGPAAGGRFEPAGGRSAPGDEDDA